MIRRITTREIRAKLGFSENFQLVEVTSPEEFDRGHIPGAISLPPNLLETRVQTYLPNKGLEVVVYSASGDSVEGRLAAEGLERLGYENIYWYESGKAEWIRENLTIQQTH